MKVRILSLIVVLVSWWVASLFASDIVIPSPLLVVDRFVDLMQSGRLPEALKIGLSALLIGGALSIVIGIPLGILMGIWRPLAEFLEHYFSALYVMPMSAVVPLMVLWFGFGRDTRVIFILIFTLPQVVVTCYQGAKNIPDTLIEVAHAFRATRIDIFFKVIIPYEIPFIITALRLGVGRAVQGMVVAELLIAGTRGIGIMIRNYSASLDLASTLAIVLFVMLLGILVTAAVRWIEDALAPWQRDLSARGGEE
jgi:ABC-type nitrate/sulfonate/bicarbonate transport system permease component